MKKNKCFYGKVIRIDSESDLLLKKFKQAFKIKYNIKLSNSKAFKALLKSNNENKIKTG